MFNTKYHLSKYQLSLFFYLNFRMSWVRS